VEGWQASWKGRSMKHTPSTIILLTASTAGVLVLLYVAASTGSLSNPITFAFMFAALCVTGLNVWTIFRELRSPQWKRRISRHWPSKLALEDYHRKEGYILGTSYCPECGETFDNAVEPKEDGTAPMLLECSVCRKMSAIFTPEQ
jgi:hypothetical protein